MYCHWIWNLQLIRDLETRLILLLAHGKPYGIEPPGENKGVKKKKNERKQSQKLINRVPIPANLEWNYQGHATRICNLLRSKKNLKENCLCSMTCNNMIYTTVHHASRIQYQKEYASPLGGGAASHICTEQFLQNMRRFVIKMTASKISPKMDVRWSKLANYIIKILVQVW